MERAAGGGDGERCGLWRPARYLWMRIARVECPRPLDCAGGTPGSPASRPIRNGSRPLPFHNGDHLAHHRARPVNLASHGILARQIRLTVTFPLVK